MSAQNRILPIYIMVDTSGSMSGENIEAVRQGVRALISDLKTDPQALETAYVSVITFDSDAQQVLPLTEIMAIQEPVFDASGSTSLGAALRLVMDAIGREVRSPSDTQKGDWKPMIFLLSDGDPTDDWESAADEIKRKRYNIIACAPPNANSTNLKRITNTVLIIKDFNPGALKEYFKWVTASIKRTSSSISANPIEGAPIDLPPPPPSIQVIP